LTSISEFLFRRQIIEIEYKKLTHYKIDRNSTIENESYHLKKLQSKLALEISEHDEELQDNGWLTPSARQVWALKSWLTRNDSRMWKIEPIPGRERLQLALIVGGGLGDVIKSTLVIPELTRLLECDVTVITDQPAAKYLKENNEYIKNVIVTSGNPYDFRESIKHSGLYDVVVRWRYTIDYFVGPEFGGDHDRLRSIVESPDKTKNAFRKFDNDGAWAAWNNAMSREAALQNLSAIELTVSTCGFDIPREDWHSHTFNPALEKLNIVRHFAGTPYVTIHNGFDLKGKPRKESATSYESTKNITTHKWKSIVVELKKLGHTVIQIGIAAEKKISGVDYYLNGQTDLSETALIMKYASCHIDTEGGLVHLNAAVHGRSAVMFGPTPVGFFGYPRNVNIKPTGCKECWWSANNWLVECPRMTPGPDCMISHQPAEVAAAVQSVVEEIAPVGISLVDTLQTMDPAEIMRLVASANLVQGENARRLAVCGGKDYFFFRDFLEKHSVEAQFAISGGEVDIFAEWASGRKVEFGSLINLRRASESMDVVICFTDMWKSEYASYVLREMLRVLKPGGVLIGALPDWAGTLGELSDILSEQVLAENFANTPAGTAAFSIRKKAGGSSANKISIATAPSQMVSPTTGPILGVLDRQISELELDAIHRRTLDGLEDLTTRFDEWERLKDATWATASKLAKANVMRDNWIIVSRTRADGYSQHFLPEGWWDLEDWGCWGKGTEHTLMLPLPPNREVGSRLLFEAVVLVNLFDKLSSRRLSVVSGTELVGEAKVTRRGTEPGRQVVIQAILDPDRGNLGRVQFVSLCCDTAFVPSALDPDCHDHRVLGLGLLQFRYRVLSRHEALGALPPQGSLVTFKSYDPNIEQLLAGTLPVDDETFVNMAYRALLRREADASGLQSHLDALRTGASRLELIAGIRNSPEGISATPHFGALDEGIS